MRLGAEFKSLPPSAWGLSADEFLATSPALNAFQTPILTLDRGALGHNVRVMAEWLVERGLQIAPHGKTTMAPQLWNDLLDAGAWAITVATPWQAQLARSFGVRRIILANEVVDPVALRWLASELADPTFEFTCWVDSVEGVAAMRSALVGVQLPRPISVLVELGGTGGRAGARGIAAALDVAAAVTAAPELALAGVAGWEASLANDRSAHSMETLSDFLDELVELHDAIEWDVTPIVTAGGSAFFELVADRLAPLVGRASVVLRSGAYQVHDDGFYLGISPFASSDARFVSAMHGWARVVSRPQPGLVLLDGGKRDFPYDLDLPVAQLVAGRSAGESRDILAGSRVLKLNDQHTYLEVRDDAELPVGSVVRLGLSHPCTAFDKWRLIPVVSDADRFDAPVVDLVRTYF